jgi:hypothetical protein
MMEILIYNFMRSQKYIPPIHKSKIESSNTIAKIGWMLSQYNGCDFDYRYFM